MVRNGEYLMPSSHPWNTGRPSFGEIVSEGVTPVGFTGPTSSPIAVNLGPANLRQSTASLTGQLINPGRGILKPGEFSPQDYPGLQLWLDSSAAVMGLIMMQMIHLTQSPGIQGCPGGGLPFGCK